MRNHMNNALYITSNLYNYESELELESSTAQHRLFFFDETISAITSRRIGSN